MSTELTEAEREALGEVLDKHVGWQMHRDDMIADLAEWIENTLAAQRDQIAEAMSDEFADRVTWSDGTEYIAVEDAQRIARGDA